MDNLDLGSTLISELAIQVSVEAKKNAIQKTLQEIIDKANWKINRMNSDELHCCVKCN